MLAVFHVNCKQATRVENKEPYVRSVSLPCRSHPTALLVEEELNKLKKWQSSSSPNAEKICSGLSGLEELYGSMNDLLTLSATQQALSKHQNEKWVGALLDGSVRLLDVCGRTRDLISQLRENVGEVQSSIRRRKGDQSIDSIISKYVSFTKGMKQDTKQLITDLKKMDNQIGEAPLLDLDHHLLSVIRILREVSSLSISTFLSILMFLAVPVLKLRPSSRWSLISKLMHKKTDKTQNTNDWEALDASLQHIDSGLEKTFRRLISTRVALLNMISC